MNTCGSNSSYNSFKLGVLTILLLIVIYLFYYHKNM